MILAVATMLLAVATVAVSRRPRVHRRAGVDASKGEWTLGIGMGFGVLSLFALGVWAKERGLSAVELWVLNGMVAVGWTCGIARRYIYGRWS